MMSTEGPQHLRPSTMASGAVLDEAASEDEVDPLSQPYSFGITPSLRLNIPPAIAADRQSAPDRQQLERQTSKSSSRSSTSDSAPLAPPKPFSLPPGLAASPLPSVVDVNAVREQLKQARGAKISNEPPIPLDIQQLLLTTPPPPRRRVKPPAIYPPIPSLGAIESRADESRPTSLLGRIRVLTLRNSGAKEPELSVSIKPRTTVPKLEVLDLKRNAIHRGALNSDLLSFHSPRTWDEYTKLYAEGRLDVEAPPRPPYQHYPNSHVSPSRAQPSLGAMTPYDLAHFSAPLNLSRLAPIRERLIANLDLLGSFLPDENILLSPQFSPQFAAQPWTSNSPSLTSGSSPISRQDSGFRSRASPNSGYRNRGWSSTSTAPSTLQSNSKISDAGDSPTLPYTQSIQAYPALQNLLDHFLVSMDDIPLSAAAVTLFPTSPASRRLEMLASAGTATEWTEFTVDVALDAHTILNGSRGLVIPDVGKDWRWKGNRDLEEKGIRFYAGMPFFAPSSLALRTSDSGFSVSSFEEEAGGARVAIGVVSIMDESPKEKGTFGSVERAKLRSLASEITSEVERFVTQRAAAIESWSSRRTSATSAATFQSAAIPNPTLHSASRQMNGATRSPTASQRSKSGRGHAKKVSFDANTVPPASPNVPPRISTPTFNEPEKLPALLQSHSPERLLELACTSVARQLDLTLVYLVELSSVPARSAVFGATTPSLALVASHGLPASTLSASDNSANFDPRLHLQALQAPEGGLLYRAASPAEPFDSGMLLPVIELEEQRKGWVIAGYAEQRGKRWGAEDMKIFETVTRGVAKILLWREEWN